MKKFVQTEDEFEIIRALCPTIHFIEEIHGLKDTMTSPMFFLGLDKKTFHTTTIDFV